MGSPIFYLFVLQYNFRDFLINISFKIISYHFAMFLLLY